MEVSKPLQMVKILKTPVKDVNVLEYKDINIPCRLCPKKFANESAIRNHLRIEHCEVQVDVSEWVQTAITDKKNKRKLNKLLLSKEGKQLIAKKTQDILSSMKPAQVTSLASTNVSYILMKAEDNYIPKPSKKKRKRQYQDPTINPKKQVKENEKSCKNPEFIQPDRIQRKKRDALPLCGPFKCQQPSAETEDGVCNKTFNSCCEYSIHFRNGHQRRGKTMKCQVCEKILRDSTGEETAAPYPCKVCGKGFQLHNLLKIHMNTEHAKLRRFECGVCHKRFTQTGGLQQHMRMHTGDRPFPCTFCEKSFTQKSGLDQHLRSHTNERPYQCVVCNKAFKQTVHLKQHMRTHTNLTPFQCIICDKRFKQGGHLTHHLRTHSEANMTDDQKKKYRDIVARSLQVQIEEDMTSSATATLQQILDNENYQQDETVVEEVVEMEEVEFDHEGDIEEGEFRQRCIVEGVFEPEKNLEEDGLEQDEDIEEGGFKQEEDKEDEIEQEDLEDEIEQEEIEETEMEQEEEIDESELEQGYVEAEERQEEHIEEAEEEHVGEIELEQDNEMYEIEIEQDDEMAKDQEDEMERVIVEQNDASNDDWSVLIVESNENSESN